MTKAELVEKVCAALMDLPDRWFPFEEPMTVGVRLVKEGGNLAPWLDWVQVGSMGTDHMFPSDCPPVRTPDSPVLDWHNFTDSYSLAGKEELVKKMREASARTEFHAPVLISEVDDPAAWESSLGVFKDGELVRLRVSGGMVWPEKVEEVMPDAVVEPPC
jgi:hypothetical protein